MDIRGKVEGEKRDAREGNGEERRRGELERRRGRWREEREVRIVSEVREAARRKGRVRRGWRGARRAR